MLPGTGGSDDPLSTIAAIFACIAASFLFAGSETAITSMGEHRVRRLLDEGKGPNRFFQQWLDDPSSLLTTLLAGNTLVNIVASALTTSLFIRLGSLPILPDALSTHAVSIGVFGLTMAVLVCGEIAPKTLAKSNPEWFLKIFYGMWAFHWTTSWLTRAIAAFAKRLVALLGVDTERGSYLVTEEQIEDMVRLADQEGSIDESRGSILQNVFDLDDTSLRSIMTPRTEMVALAVDFELADILQRVQESGFSRFPVYEGTKDQIKGIFYAKKLLSLVGSESKDFVLSDHWSEAMYAPDTQKASRLLADFQARAVHMAVVVDEHGGTAGIVTLEDVLEELVGEIYDEDDEIEQPIEQTGPDSWICDASVELSWLEEELSLSLPESESYSTVGGFVTEQLGHVPNNGESVIWKRVQVTVLESDDKRAHRVQLERLPDEAELEEAV